MDVMHIKILKDTDEKALVMLLPLVNIITVFCLNRSELNLKR